MSDAIMSPEVMSNAALTVQAFLPWIAMILAFLIGAGVIAWGLDLFGGSRGAGSAYGRGGSSVGMSSGFRSGGSGGGGMRGYRADVTKEAGKLAKNLKGYVENEAGFKDRETAAIQDAMKHGVEVAKERKAAEASDGSVKLGSTKHLYRGRGRTVKKDD